VDVVADAFSEPLERSGVSGRSSIVSSRLLVCSRWSSRSSVTAGAAEKDAVELLRNAT
jgi:hypothetical protein